MCIINDDDLPNFDLLFEAKRAAKGNVINLTNQNSNNQYLVCLPMIKKIRSLINKLIKF